MKQTTSCLRTSQGRKQWHAREDTHTHTLANTHREDWYVCLLKCLKTKELVLGEDYGTYIYIRSTVKGSMGPVDHKDV